MVLGAEGGTHHAGVQRGGRDPTALQASRQFVGEHHVGQLGRVVGALPRVLQLALQIVEIQAAERMGAGGHSDNPRRCAGLQPVQQQVRQQERGEVIERERVLQAVGGDVPVRPEPADVVDEHIQARVPVEHFAREASYFGLRRQVRGERVDRRVIRRGADVGRGRLRASDVAPGDSHPSAQSSEPDRRRLADPTGTARDKDRLTCHQSCVSHGCFRSCPSVASPCLALG